MAGGGESESNLNIDTSQIRTWRSIVTLIVFILTNLAVLFPFNIPIFVPTAISNGFRSLLIFFRVLSPPKSRPHDGLGSDAELRTASSRWERLSFPINFITAPLIADIFLLAILAIGRAEVKGGTVGANNIAPYDIMLFFISLAYIAISVDVSGLIKYMAYKVLSWGGSGGYRLYFYLYAFFFSLTTFIGNDPIILSGTPFLAYMTRVSSNIKSPRAWIFAQFSVANIASTILVSSNPTNLVVAGAFQVKFINYSANVIVPTIATGIALFPFLLYVYFRNDSLIPKTIEVHTLPDELQGKSPVNPNIPYSRGIAEEQAQHQDSGLKQILELEEILNPFLDRTGAIVGATVMGVTLVTVLAVNAALASSGGEIHVFWIVLPAAVAMFFFDVWWGWRNRHETRKIAREGRLQIAHTRRTARADQERKTVTPQGGQHDESASNFSEKEKISRQAVQHGLGESESISVHNSDNDSPRQGKMPVQRKRLDEKTDFSEADKRILEEELDKEDQDLQSLQSIVRHRWQWCRETFPTASTVLSMLPLPLVPFAFSMFVLVQALVTKGWVPVFAYGWDHWVNRTGTVGAIGGMGFVSVVLCNFAGTNIGTAILLSRVLQAWQEIHRQSGIPITNRTFWGTVYSMAIGLNYGAFSTAFSASLAGMLWRDILDKKGIFVKAREFALVNLPIIALTMAVGCAVLVGQIYIIRGEEQYNAT